MHTVMKLYNISKSQVWANYDVCCDQEFSCIKNLVFGTIQQVMNNVQTSNI